jgi:hypothetical protein
VKKYKPMATDKVAMKHFVAMAALAVVGLLCAIVVSVGPASAGSAIVRTIAGGGTPPPAPSGTAVVESLPEVAQAASVAKDNASVFVLAYDMAQGMSKVKVIKAKAAGKCMTIGDGTKISGFWNSGIDRNGHLWWFWDTRTTLVCRFGNEWRKVGPHNCGNLIRFKMPKTHVIKKGVVVLVQSFGRYSASVTVKATAHAHGDCGDAFASAKGTAMVSGASKMKARGNANLVANVKATVSAYAQATASVKCSTPPVITITTPTGTTTVTVTTPPPPPSTTTVVTTTTHTTTSVTTTTVPTTTTTPAQHSCSLNVPNVPKDANPYVATAIVTGDVAPSAISWNWGDGNVTSGVDGVSTTRQHTYPTPAPGAAGYVSYVIDVHADFGTQKNVPCGMVQFSVPIPPPSGTTTVPTLPGG